MCPPSSFQPSSDPPKTTASTINPSDLVFQSPMCTTAYEHVQQSLSPAVFNHSLRVYHYARALAGCMESDWLSPDRLPLLFIACLFHDMGCTIENDPQRFEVCGADAAANHFRKFDVNDGDSQEVWTAIACHTSPGIGERISSLARLVRLAVLIDFHALSTNPWITERERKVGEEIDRRSIEEQYPRMSIEKVLGNTVAEQGMRQPIKAPAHSWAGILVRAAKENPDWEGVNKAF